MLSLETGEVKVIGPGSNPRYSPSGHIVYGADGGNHWWPEMLPSGEAVLFTMVPGTGADNAQLAVLGLEEGAPKLLNLGGTHPRYVPTGLLVYGVDNTLRAVRFDAGRLEVTSDPIPVVDG